MAVRAESCLAPLTSTDLSLSVKEPPSSRSMEAVIDEFCRQKSSQLTTGPACQTNVYARCVDFIPAKR